MCVCMLEKFLATVSPAAFPPPSLLERAAAPSVAWNPVLRSLCSALLEAPLLHIFLHGPAIGGYGFWEGKPLSGICQEMTQISAAHWEHNPAVCEALVERKFDALLVLVYFGVYLLVLRILVYWAVAVCRRLSSRGGGAVRFGLVDRTPTQNKYIKNK